MKIVNFLIDKITPTAEAVTLDLCYLTGPTQPIVPEYTFWSAISEYIEKSLTTKLIFLIIAPLVSAYIFFVETKALLKRKNFSVLYAIYKNFIKTLLLAALFAIFELIVAFITIPEENILMDQMNNIIIFIILVSIISVSIGAAVGIILNKPKNKKLLLLALSSLLVLPTIIIGLYILVISLIPGLRKYLPKDAIEFKKKQLKSKLKKQGKLPKQK